MNEKKSQIEIMNSEINRELSNEQVGKALLATTFKGLTPITMKQAILEGMMRGFVFKDFLEKNVYAIPFGGGYSLITSIDYARKIGMRSGIVGKEPPIYEEQDGKILTCAVTVKRKVSGYVGDFTAKVYFDEYNTKKNQWLSKPRTMIAKVAEMHALRMACPEELSQQYIEEEMQLEHQESPQSRIEEAVKESEPIKMGSLFEANENKKDTGEIESPANSDQRKETGRK